MKKIFLITLIVLFGTFIYLKVQLNRDINSQFNQTTRYELGRHNWLRVLLGLHYDGDARADYLGNHGTLTIDWFKPASETVDPSLVKNFADLVSKNLNRPTQVFYGGAISDGTIDPKNLSQYDLESYVETGRSDFNIYFTDDYTGRPADELSRTFLESGMIISMSAHKSFLVNFNNDINQYYLSSMLHEFGHQIGLEHNKNSDCIMSEHAGINGLPVEQFGRTEPQDYCPFEQIQIQALISQYK